MNEIIKRYNIGLSIINNNRGLIAMLKTIYNKISSIINNMLEKVGYHLIGYKVDIELLMTNTRFCKSWVIKNGDDIKGLKKAHNINKEKFVVYSEMIMKLNTRIDMLESDLKNDNKPAVKAVKYNMLDYYKKLNKEEENNG